MLSNKIKPTIKQISNITIACLAAYGTILGIIQFYESKTSYIIAGEWNLNLQILSTSYDPYQDSKVEYKIYIFQNKKSIQGKGEKWSFNEVELPSSQHDPIELNGIISNNKLPLFFKLKGSRRETVGIFNMKILNNNEMIGTFSTTGANAKGTVTMTRTK